MLVMRRKRPSGVTRANAARTASIVCHRPQLVDRERLFLVARSDLAKEDSRSHRQPDSRRSKREDRRYRYQAGRCKHDVGCAFDS